LLTNLNTQLEQYQTSAILEQYSTKSDLNILKSKITMFVIQNKNNTLQPLKKNSKVKKLLTLADEENEKKNINWIYYFMIDYHQTFLGEAPWFSPECIQDEEITCLIHDSNTTASNDHDVIVLTEDDNNLGGTSVQFEVSIKTIKCIIQFDVAIVQLNKKES
ncbi:hypothetical protein RFI_29082, partial [Reticulomyxa filosa]